MVRLFFEYFAYLYLYLYCNGALSACDFLTGDLRGFYLKNVEWKNESETKGAQSSKVCHLQAALLD